MEINTLSVRATINEIHARVASQTQSPAALADSETWLEETSSLRTAYDSVYRTRTLVGQFPPSPKTLRARAGGCFVRLVQRMLFWYTPQILQFHNAVVTTLERICEMLEREWSARQALHTESQEIKRRMSRLEVAVDGVSARRNIPAEAVRGERPGDGSNFAGVAGRSIGTHTIDHFVFALQDRFRGSEQSIQATLKPYLDFIAGLRPAVPKGGWLDIGSGRGEWLRVARNAGYDAIGVDSNPHAVKHCVAQGLPVVQDHALEYLKKQPEGSLAVITAFHVVEHWPFAYTLEWAVEAARVLIPGGLVVVEAPQPANLNMGSHLFWKDPTHERPLPMSLLEFLFQYCGLAVIEKLELHPSEWTERLPFAELEFVSRIDKYLHGGEDYAVVARR